MRAVIGRLSFALIALTASGAPEAVAGQDEHQVAWHQVRMPSPGKAQVIGGYAHGCLAGGVALPLDGPGYQVMRPNRRRMFGHPELIDYLQALGRRVQSSGIGVMALGDLAQPRGGPTPSGHASHQNGLDVDIWLRLDLPLLPRDQRDNPKEVTVIDRETLRLIRPAWGPGQAQLLRLAARDSRVDRIFVNPVIKQELCRQAGSGDRSWLHVIRPWYGHDDHVHVRLSCPAGSPLCEPQKPLPPGDGCDEDLTSWAIDARPHDPNNPPKSPTRHPVLPAACYQINLAASDILQKGPVHLNEQPGEQGKQRQAQQRLK